MGQFDKIHELIAQEAAAVVEQASTAKVEAVFEDKPVKEDILIYTEFTCKFNGKLWFTYPNEIASELSAGFTGMSADELDDDMITDTIKEISNMVASGVLLRFFGQTRYDVIVPEIHIGDQIAAKLSEIPENSHPFIFKVGDHFFKLIVYIYH